MLKIQADMVELADTPDLGSGARACRFKSCYPHIVIGELTLSYYYMRITGDGDLETGFKGIL